MKKIIALISVCMSFAAVYAATSPVVQVVSYKEPLGLYFSLQGWGSGSIIDNQGHIVTNNHVVDDGVGGISDDFAICMTDNPMLPPKCYYTASVVSRDADADVAVLQIDSTDIFGNRVDFNSLSKLTMDLDYVPQSGDVVTARGYPWIGANTITETQGIISGTSQYNGNMYIKTDTLIAGGNSGGPLIREGKMIGVNTFLVGGGYDPALGYSLLINEADKFIKEALSQKEKLQSNNPEFPKFLQTVETFSSQKKITDPLITVNLPETYVVNSYIPAMSLTASISDTNTTSVSSFSFFHMRTPQIMNLVDLQKYLTSAMGAPKGSFNQTVIGGKTFYELIFDENPENSKTKNSYLYFTVVDNTHLLFLYLETPVPTKNTLDKIQKSAKDFLNNIVFPNTFVFPKNADVTIPGAGLVIKSMVNSSILYDISEYDGLLSGLTTNEQDFVMVRNFLGNFWSKAQMSVFKNSFETEDDSIDMWRTKIVERMYVVPVVNKKIMYRGHEGLLICFEDSIIDESGKNNDIMVCETVFFVGEKREFIISAQMILPKKQLKRIDKLMLQYLDRTSQVPDIGETLFTPEKIGTQLPYSDIAGQSPAFQAVLGQLLSYGILTSRPQFDGDAPLLWKDYLSLYIWIVYHRQISDQIIKDDPTSPTFEKVLSTLPVVLTDYVEADVWQLDKINSVIRLLVAGGSLPKYDVETIMDFSGAANSEEGIYRDAWKTIVAFESIYFANRASIESAKYTSEKIITYNPFLGIEIKDKNQNVGESFVRNNSKSKAEVDKMLRCEKNASVYFSLECREMRKKSLLDYLTYSVLTKGEALESILPYIDSSLWNNVGSEGKKPGDVNLTK